MSKFKNKSPTKILISLMILIIVFIGAKMEAKDLNEAEIIHWEEISVNLIAEIFQDVKEIGNWAYIEQEGEDLEVDISQMRGGYKEADVRQDGIDLLADIVQSGDNHKAIINQSGRQMKAIIYQYEARENIAEIIQKNGYHFAQILQEGQNNYAAIKQNNYLTGVEAENIVEIIQLGSDNQARVTQKGNNNVAKIHQFR